MKSEYNYGLALMRIMAMAMVFSCHISNRLTTNSSINSVLSCGAAGVPLFFVLSGFLNSKSIEKMREAGKSSAIYFYKRRAISFFVPYYISLLAIIFVRAIAGMKMPQDMFGIRWIRYALCINQVVPANNYEWTNLYGFWTISSFAFFYLVTPVIAKVKSMKMGIVLLFTAIGMQYINNIIYKLVFGANKNICDLSTFAGNTPFHSFYVFILGFVIYRGISENKIQHLLILLSFFIMGGIVFDKVYFIWSGCAGLLIMGSDAIVVKNKRIRLVIQSISEVSFEIYLCHMFCFDIMDEIWKYNYNKWIWFVCCMLLMLSVAFTISKLSQYCKKVLEKVEKK